MDAKETINHVEQYLKDGIDVVCAGLDQDSRGKPWETSSFLLGLADKITKIYGFCNVCGLEATKTYRKTTAKFSKLFLLIFLQLQLHEIL